MGGVKGGDLFLPVDFHCVRGFENEREEGMGGLSFGFSFDVFLLCLYVWVFIYLIGDLFFGGGGGGELEKEREMWLGEYCMDGKKRQ